jgi:S1-C subfamily serine protease
LLGHGLVLTAMDAVSVRAGTGEPLPLDDIEVAGLGDDAARPAALLVLIDGAGLALLRADAFADAPLPRYGNSTALDAGAPVYLASDSREGDPLVSGAVRGEIDRELSNATLRYVETTLPPDPALDGAPVFDANGEVIGVAAGRGSNGLVFLRIEDVRQVLRPIASAR